MDLEKRIEEIFHEIVEIRRDFHMYPELSQEEFRTNEKISSYLDEMGIEHERNVATTGLVGIIRGKKPGRTVGLRADMDALPIVENNDLTYKSRHHGIMHACGHDVHMAINLGVGKILKEMEDDLEGNIKLIFQPAEETVGGAKRIINEGFLDNPRVDYILALHLMPRLEASEVELKYGKLNAANDEFLITIEGRGGHGAYPEEAIDPILVGGHIIVGLQSLVSRNTSPLNPVVLSFGQIKSGTKNNIIPARLKLSGTLRTLDKETQAFAMERISEISKSIAQAYGARARVDFIEGYPPLINNNEVVDVLNEVARESLGHNKVFIKELPSMGADDFSFFLEEVKGAYYYLGCGNKAKGYKSPIHNENFLVDEECIKTGILVQVRTALKLLEKG